MACYRPLKAFDTGELTKNGKPKYKICDGRTDHIEMFTDGVWEPCYDDYVSGRHPVRNKYVIIPCGKCIGCRLEYSKQWAMRCMLEAKEHESSYFCTFTYNDSLLRSCSGVSPVTGEILEGYTLDKRDLQLFFKRLREDQKVRYYACGEYGSRSYRPHYHAIIFGLKLDDLKLYRRSPNGDCYYTSEYLAKKWKLGYVIIGEVSFESCAYTARYVAKKVHEDLTQVYEAYGMAPEFVLMSRKPGIARNYVETHPDLFDFNSIVLSGIKGSIQGNIPRYFKKVAHDRLLDDLYCDYSAFHSKLRQDLERSVIENETGMNYMDYLEELEGKKLRQITALRRDSV